MTHAPFAPSAPFTPHLLPDERPAPGAYETHPGWRDYERFFPAPLRASEAGRLPSESWWRWRGLDVHLDRMGPDDAPATVVVLHGVGAYGRVMAPAALLAERHGFRTVAPDLPGFGLTRVPWRQLDYALWVDCACALVRAEAERTGRPVVVLGVSLGGLVAWQVATRVPQVAALIATTLADPRERDVRRGFSRWPWLGTVGLGALSALGALSDGLPLPIAAVSRMDRIAADAALGRVVMNDRAGGGSWVPARFLKSLMTLAPAVEPERFVGCPVLLAHPGADEMTPIALSRRFFDRLAAPRRMVVLEGSAHMPTSDAAFETLERETVAFVSGALAAGTGAARSPARARLRPQGP